MLQGGGRWGGAHLSAPNPNPNPYPIANLKSLPEHSGAQVLNVESEVAGGVAEHTRAVLDFFLSECQGFAIDLAQLGRGR